MRRHTRVVFLLAIAGACLIPGSSATTAGASAKRGMWVWPANREMTSREWGSALVASAAVNRITDLYISEYLCDETDMARPDCESTTGRMMPEDDTMAELIAAAHVRHVRVWAVYGDPGYIAQGCATTQREYPRRLIADVVGFNAARPDAGFDGVMLDIEPAASVNWSIADFRSLLDLFDCLHADLSAAGIPLGAAIRFNWDAPIAMPVGGTVKPVYAHILDRDFAQVVVMGYSQQAGTRCDAPHTDNGSIICRDQDEIDYAHAIGKDGLVLAGLETQSSADPDIAAISFFNTPGGESTMTHEMVIVSAAFADRFGGYAIHAYRMAYLSGLPYWPAGLFWRMWSPFGRHDAAHSRRS